MMTRRTTWFLLAVGLLGGVLAARGSRTESVVGLLHRSRVAIGATNFAEALEFAQAAVRQDPAYGEAWKQQGRVFMLMNLPAVADASFATALELMPDDADIPRWRLHQEIDLGRNREVLDQLDRQTDAELAAVDEAVITRVLTEVIDSGAREQAAALSARWARAAPRAESRRIAAALTQVLGGRTDEADAALRQVKPPPGTPTALAALAWDQVGQAQLAARDAKRAIHSFDRALALQPDAQSPLRNLGWAYRADRQPAEAIAAWQKGVAARTNAVEWLAWIAEAQLDLRRPADAARSAGKLLEARPDSERAQQLRLASLLILLKDRGMPEFVAGADDTPRGARTIHLAYAMAQRYHRQFPEAAHRLETLYQQDTADADVKRLLIDTYAQWAASAGKAEAIGPLSRILDIEPGHTGALRDLGWVYWARGDRERALGLLDRAVRGGVANRDEVMNQVYIALAEADQTSRGLEMLRGWAGPTSLLALGRDLFRRGRLSAAEPALESAWDAQELPAESGLLLAQCRALSGRCYGLDKLLAPAFEQPMTNASPEDLDLLFECLDVCEEAPRSRALLGQLERTLGRRPAPGEATTDLLERAAEQRRQLRDYGHAFRLYVRVLRRDPDRLCWVRAADAAEALGRRARAHELLKDTLARTTSDAVRRGIEGKLAEYEGDLARSARLYARSLEANPEQPELRYNLFGHLVALGRLAEAREQVTWFVQRLDSGDMQVRTHLAEMWTALGEADEALEFWTALSKRYPDSPYYTVERARALFRLGRPDDAMALLKDLNGRMDDVRSYELMAEMELALARPREAIVAADKGLDIELTPGLLRTRAMAAESSGSYSSAFETANALLAVDPGDADMARLLGRSLIELDEPEEARDYLSGLTNRNAAFLPALVGLYEVAGILKDTTGATHVAKVIADQRPWDLEARGRLASAVARSQGVEPAMEVLRPWADEGDPHPVTALVYRDVTRRPYPGRTRADQVAEHIARLAREGYAFLTPDQVEGTPASAAPAVLLFIADAERVSLELIDRALEKHGGRATYAGFTSAEEREAPGKPTRKDLERLVKSGRWQLASSGPAYLRRIAVDARGTQGNPLTHRQVSASDTGSETDAQMRERVGGMLADMAAPLAGVKVLLYPQGDYGHLSLDTDPAAMDVLRSAAAGHFQQAYAADDAGFLTRESDPLRRPVKTVPPRWSADDLMRHLETRNPHRALRRLYERLQRKDRQRTLAAGADTRSSEFNWEAYTFEQTDDAKFMALIEQSYARRAYDAATQDERERARRSVAPTPNLYYNVAREEDNRRHVRAGATLNARATDRAQVEGLVDYNWWKRDRTGDEDGLRYGAGGRWFFRPQYWVDGRLYRMDYRHESLRDFWGGFVRLRVPSALLNGDITVEASRDEVGTAEAIRAAIEQWHYALRAYSRVWDDVDVFVNGALTDRDDGNQSWMADAKMVWPVAVWPFMGLGPYVRFADSDRASDAYYSPQDLRQVQLFGTFRGGINRLNYSGSLQGGMGQEEDHDWRFVWAGRLLAELDVGAGVTPFGEVKYQELPAYSRYQVAGGVNFLF